MMKSTAWRERKDGDQYLSITLPSVIVDIRVGRILLLRLLEGFERFCRVALFHVDASNLDPTLSQRGC